VAWEGSVGLLSKGWPVRKQHNKRSCALLAAQGQSKGECPHTGGSQDKCAASNQNWRDPTQVEGSVLTSVGCIIPIDAIPTPALAVPYEAPRLANTRAAVTPIKPKNAALLGHRGAACKRRDMVRGK